MSFLENNAWVRHEMLSISLPGRKRLYEDALASVQSSEHCLLSEVFFGESWKRPAPGIVRRSIWREGCVPVGFVHPFSDGGRRFRLASYVREDDVIERISPYNLMRMVFETKKDICAMLKEITGRLDIFVDRIGVIGSVAMEIFTGRSYTHMGSDLDLVVRNLSQDELGYLYGELARQGEKYGRRIDIEVELSNGYGIKARELFSQSSTLLGKSISDVRILKRSTVANLL